jgi:hypothetical protein
MSIAADGRSAPLPIPDAAARVLEFTQAACPGDLPVILSALSPAELTAGVARLGPRAPEPVIDHVIAHGPAGARRALAWQLRLPLRHASILGYDTARRELLRLADPEVDRALFGRLEQAGLNWVRSAILRDRVGADGEAIVPPNLRAELADFLSTAVLPRSPADLADTDTGDPEFELLRVLAGARDQGLAIPAARVLGLPGPIPATQPGWRDQTWVGRWDRPGVGSRSWRLDWDEVLELAADREVVAGDRGRFLGQVAGLDEAAAREDIPRDVRSQLLKRYPQATWHAGAPDVTTLRQIPAALKALAPRWGDPVEEQEFRSAIRMLIIRGLSLGTLTAAEVLEHAVPASAVLDLAWRSADAIVPAARGRADLAEELRRRLQDRLGDDHMLWYTTVARSFLWSGTVAELIDSVADLGEDQAFPPYDELDERYEDAPNGNVLLAFSPPEVVREFLSEGPGPLSVEELFLLSRRPLAPGLVARGLAADAGHDARRTLAANPVTPASALRSLLHHSADPVTTRLSLVYDGRDPDIRYAALELLEESGTPWAQITHFVKNLGDASVYRLIAAAPTAERLFVLLKKWGQYLGPETTWLLYGQLAEEAGPEPVWELATAAAGSIDEVDAFVRASMTSGAAEPLVLAAERVVALRKYPGVTAPDPDTDPAPHPDDPARWPLEAAVRQHLDNHPERWRIMVRRLMAAGDLDYPRLVDLVEAVGRETGEDREGAP